MTAPPQYEFNTKQNDIIERLARAMLWIAAPLQLVGVLYLLGAILAAVRTWHEPGAVTGALLALLAAIFFLALGRWTRNAATAFERVVTTTGNDVDHVMEGLDNLRKMYSLLSTLVKIYVALLLIGLIVGAVAAFGVALWR